MKLQRKKESKNQRQIVIDMLDKAGKSVYLFGIPEGDIQEMFVPFKYWTGII